MLRKREHSPISTRCAYGLVLGAYVLWAFLPVYWPYLCQAGPIEILAHRMVWWLVAGVVAVLLLRRSRQLHRLFATRPPAVRGERVA